MATILIVDDHIANRQFLVALLGDEHRLLEASEGSEGLRLAATEYPDLIIIAIAIPVLDGYELVALLRQAPFLADTPVIFYTGIAAAGDVAQGARAVGVVTVLRKPSAPEVILAAVHRELGLPRPAAGVPGIPAGERRLAGAPRRSKRSLTDFQDTSLRLTTMIQLGIELTSARHIGELADTGCRFAYRVGLARYAVIGIYAGSGGMRIAALGLPPEVATLVAESTLAGRVCQAVMTTCSARRLHGQPAGAGATDGHQEPASLLAVPIVASEKVYGCLFLGDKLGADGFSEADEAILLAVGTQIAAAYEKMLLLEQLQLNLARLKSESVARQQAEAQLRQSETRFRQLAESINEMVFLTDRGNTVMLYISPAYEWIFGRTCASLYADPASWIDAIHPDDLWIARKYQADSLAEDSRHAHAFSLKYRIVRPDGAVRLIFVRGFPILNDEGEAYRTAGIAEDITDDVSAMDELRESEQRILRIIENTPGMVFQCQLGAGGGALKFSHVSEGAVELLALSPAAIKLDRNVLSMRFLEHDRVTLEDSLFASAASMTIWNWDGRTVAIDGKEKWVNCRATPRLSKHGDVIWEGVMLDVSERRESEVALTRSRQLLRKLSAHMENVREEERKRIAREVHDDLGQALTVLRMDIALLRLVFGAENPPLCEHICSMTDKVDDTIRIVRHITAALRPVSLDLGVVAGLEWLVAQVNHRGGTRVRLVSSGRDDIVLGQGGDTALFRIIQESLNNVLKHAQASEAEVRIDNAGGGLRFQIRDNGIGFCAGSETKPGSFGLIGIRERALALGWALTVESASGRGACIKLVIPSTWIAHADMESGQ